MFSEAVITISDGIDRISGKHQRVQNRLRRKEKREQELLGKQHELSENVQHISDYVENLKNVIIESVNNITTYDVENGTCWGEGIINEDEFAIQKSFMSEGAIFPVHAHSEYEILIVISGCIVAYFDGGHKEASEGDVIYFEQDQEHKVIAQRDTWLFGITIPAEEGYPNE